MRQLTIIFIILISLITTTSCSDDTLNNTLARKLFKEKVNNKPLAHKIQPGVQSGDFQKLRKLGYVTYGEYDIFLTEKGKKYLIDRKGKIRVFNIGEIEFEKIIQIDQVADSNEAIVTYTVNHSINHLGKEVFQKEDGIVHQKAAFTKYADGWRVDQFGYPFDPATNN